RRETFMAHGGFDATGLLIAHRDIDLALKLRSSGLKILWTPHVKGPRARSSRSGKGGAQPRRAPGIGRALGRRLDRGAEPQPVLASSDTAVPLAIDAVGGTAVAAYPALCFAEPVASGSRRHSV